MMSGTIPFIMALAFSCGVIDTSVGMGYGTILTPVLIIMGFDPLTVIPAVLLSQAICGLSASVFHILYGNISMGRNSKDLTVLAIITGWCIVATLFAARVSVNIPGNILKPCIGLLVIGVGIFLLIPIRHSFSWGKIIIMATLSAINKGLSGGGFGPLVTGGQILSGRKPKRAIGVTTVAEVPICITAFITWVITESRMNGSFVFSGGDQGLSWWESISRMGIIWALIFGVVFAAPLGPYLTRKIRSDRWRYVLGPVILAIGVWFIIHSFLPATKNLPIQLD